MTTEFLIRLILGLAGVQALIGAAIGIAAKRFAEKSVDHAFDRRLEKFRSELQSVTESIRFDFQRQLQDVTHFASKRHEISAKLFQRIRRADGSVRGLYGMRQVPDYEKMTEKEFVDAMNSHRVAESLQAKVLSVWRNDRRDGIRDLTPILRRIEVAEARSDWRKAYNYFLLNEIYLSDAVGEAATNVLDLLFKIIIDAELPPDPAFKSQRTDRGDVLPLIEALRIALRAELGRGYAGEIKVSRLADQPDSA